MREQVRRGWLGCLVAAAALFALAPAAYGEGAADLQKHAAGGSWLSATVFCLIGGVAVYLVFKGTRSG